MIDATFVDSIKIIQEIYSELRITQILSIAAKKAGWNNDDLFYCPDEIIQKGLRLFLQDENSKLDIKQKVQMICNYAGISISELSKRLNVLTAAFNSKIKTGKLTKEELENIAEKVECKYISYFKFPDGVVITANTIGQQIRNTLSYANMSISELGRKVGYIHFQQSMSDKISNGKFTQKELHTLANYMGCEYISEFQFEDGTIV